MMTRQVVVAFPLDRRSKLVAGLAAQTRARHQADAEKHLTVQLRRQAAALVRKQITDDVARLQVFALERAVRAELWRVHFTPQQPNGKAGP
jgi:hypothetical protein